MLQTSNLGEGFESFPARQRLAVTFHIHAALLQAVCGGWARTAGAIPHRSRSKVPLRVARRFIADEGREEDEKGGRKPKPKHRRQTKERWIEHHATGPPNCPTENFEIFRGELRENSL